MDLSGIAETELHRLTAIAASGSQHPLDQAVINYPKDKGVMISNPYSS